MSSRPGLNAHVEEVLAPCAQLWKEAQGLPEQRLLRLAILRDLIRAMHAERSRLLALSQPERAEALRRIEPHIEALKRDRLAAASLPGLVAATDPTKPPAPCVPEEIEAAVGEGKFRRYDRQWEAEIAAEAYRQGWQFWTLEAWIDIMKAENFHQSLNQGLWPKGIVLFVESCTDTADMPAEGSVERSIWKGRWLVVHAKDRKPHERPLEQLPGAVRQLKASDWRLVLAPRSA